MSFTLNYTGDEINAILARANNGGEIDDELALKAPLVSPALTGNPTAPTQPEEDSSTKVATTEYADRAADAAEAAAEAASKEYTDAATGALYITDTASGSIASFSDGADGIPMRSVKAQIEPVQDLHGYGAPWPAGGGKNKAPTFNNSGTNSGRTYAVNPDGSVTVTGTATGQSNKACLPFTLPAGTYTVSGYPNGATASKWDIIVRRTSDSTVIARGYTNSPNATFTLTESTEVVYSLRSASVSGQSDTVTFYPQIEVGSTATSYAPYSNECPISGWTGAEPVRTGVNVWDGQWERGGYDSTTGAPIYDVRLVRNKNIIKALPSASYYAYCNPSFGTVYPRMFFYDEDGNYISTLLANSGVFTTPARTGYMTFHISASSLGDGDISINYPATATSYEPYAGQTFPVTWESQAGEVFGGTIDVVSGELKVDWGGKDMGTQTWTYESAQMRFKSETLAGLTDGANAICSLYKRGSSLNALTDGQFFIGATGNTFVKDSRYTDAADFKAAVAGQTIVYPLAQPVIYQLSAQQITSLLGQNNVWSNTGDTEVEYVADPKLYIAKMLGGGALTLGSVSPLSVNRPVTISEEDLEQAGEASEAVEAAAETVLPAESGETEEGAQE